MKTRLHLKTLYCSVLLGGCLGAVTHSEAGELSLSQSPLFLGFQAKPNILFVIDDSGSMDWEAVTTDFNNNQLFTATQPDGTNPAGAGNPKHRDSDDDGTADCGFGSGSFTGYLYGVEFGSNNYGDDGLDCNTADDEAWRFRNSDFNPLYFNPNATYKPWSGVDSSGTPFGNIDITNAPNNPYSPTEWIDLTQHNSNWGGASTRNTSDRDSDGSPDGFRYYTWTDTDADGNFDNGEETEVLIKNADAATKQNFANWFSYYRSRENVAKAAYGKLIAEADSTRMGMVTLHNNNSVNRPIRAMNASPSSGDKRTLLNRLYSFQGNNGTPLRTTVNEAGRYLECQSNAFFGAGECPAESAAAGGNCQQNFAVVMTDGFYNGSFSFSSGANKDGDANTTFDGGAYADGRSHTLADIAMHYYERDLHTSLDNDVPTIVGVDEADHQHQVTYTVAFGVEGTLNAMPPNETDPFAWPDPGAGNAQRIDDLRHAAYNGRGLYLSARQPQQLITALNDALSDIGDRTGSAAPVATNTTSLDIDTKLFQARFNGAGWSGEFIALPVNADGTVGSPEWNTADELAAQDWNTGREILTFNTDSDPANRGGVAFRWANLYTAQQAALNDDPATPAVDNDGEGAARLNYLRGDDSNEGTGNNYRVRTSKLGDIVDSAPVFVGAPAFVYPDNLETPNYSDFFTTYKDRTPMVYVGANDGMMHGIRVSDGREIFAYVPGELFPRLNQLSNPAYVHRYYVDGPVISGDAIVGGAWKTVVAGSLRAGGQGIYALDVTNPATLLNAEGSADSVVLWEFTDSDDPDMGYTFGAPAIARMKNGKWAVIFGNGYNNTEADGNASTTGNAVLYIAFLDEGTDGVWNIASDDYIKLDTGRGTADSADGTTPNGLSSPAPVDVNGDRIVDFIYAGDYQGNMWKFDVRSATASAWEIDYQDGSSEPQPLFTATDASSPAKPQPITTRPRVGLHPEGRTGFVVYFGTGKYFEAGDNSTIGQVTQTFYGIWDKNETTLLPFNRSHLLKQEILEELVATFDTDGDGVDDVSVEARINSDNDIVWHEASGNPTGTPPTTHLGWYLDLVNTEGGNTNNYGERQVTDSLLRTGRIIFTTLSPSGDPCDFGGNGWLMELDVRNGGRLDFTPFDFTQDDVFSLEDYIQVQATTDVNGDGIVDANDKIYLPSSGLKLEGIPSQPVYLSGGGDTGGGGDDDDDDDDDDGGPPGPDYKEINTSNGTIRTISNNPGPGQEGRHAWRQMR